MKKILVYLFYCRVTRFTTTTDKPKINKRERRQIIEQVDLLKFDIFIFVYELSRQIDMKSIYFYRAIQPAGFVISVAKAMKNTERYFYIIYLNVVNRFSFFFLNHVLVILT